MKRLSCSYYSKIDTAEFNASISGGVSGAVVDENCVGALVASRCFNSGADGENCVGDLDRSQERIKSEGKPFADSLPMPLTGGVCDYLEIAGSGTDEIIETTEVVEIVLPNERGLYAGSNGSNIQGTSLALDSNASSLSGVANFESSISEQDIRDVMFEAGYTTDSINEIIEAKGTTILADVSSSSLKESDIAESESVKGNALDILKELRVKNVNKIMIGTLNINSLAPKFDQLSEIIGKNLDIFTVQETKLDPSFPSQQFMLAGYSEPYRLDRDRDGGGGS